MGDSDDWNIGAGERADGGVVQLQPQRHTLGETVTVTHAQPEVQRHELPGTIHVSGYHEYTHADRWAASASPLTEDDKIDWLASDEWVAYDVDIREAGPYDLTLRVAAADSFGGGTVGIAVDDDTLCRVQFDPTGGWYSWADVETAVELPRGLHTIRLVVYEGGWKLKQLQFG